MSSNRSTQIHKRRLLSAAILLAFGSLSLGTANAEKIARGDFNGDGRDDMLVGIPFENVGSIQNAGAASVFYGLEFAGGLYFEPYNQLHQDTPESRNRAAIEDTAEVGDRFGEVIAVGDFDNDGYEDAAISAPREDSFQGAVHIQYGSISGVYGPRNDFFTLARMQYGTIDGKFGDALATGDINGDGYDDLAIGVTRHDGFIDMKHIGGVMVMYGSANGLTKFNTQFIFQYYPDVPGDSEESDYFGRALAMDDFDRDGYADLAIGIPNKDINGVNDAGGVVLLYGGANGIVGNGNQTAFFQR